VAGEVYQGLPQTPIGERDRRRKLRKLVEYGLLECEGENRNREYRVCDREIVGPIETPLSGAGVSDQNIYNSRD